VQSGFAKTPQPPYYAVIFTSQRTEGDHGYDAMAQAMFDLAVQHPGCLGAERARGTEDLRPKQLLDCAQSGGRAPRRDLALIDAQGVRLFNMFAAKVALDPAAVARTPG